MSQQLVDQLSHSRTNQMLTQERKDGDESLMPESYRSQFMFQQPTERLYQYYDEKKVTGSEPRIEDEEEANDDHDGLLENTPDSVRRKAHFEHQSQDDH